MNISKALLNHPSDDVLIARNRSDMIKPSFTTIPSDVVNICLSFLDDADLLRANSTSSTFLRGYFKFYRASNKMVPTHLRMILSWAKRGYIYSSITHLDVCLPHNSTDFKYLVNQSFPNLTSLKLEYVCVNSLPINPTIEALSLVGCT